MAQKKRKGGTGAQASSLKTFYAILGVVAVVGLGALVWVLAGGRAGTATEPIQLGFETTDAQLLLERAAGQSQGPETAPVRVVEFADYQCPACATFASQMKPTLHPYIERGDVRYTYFDYPIISAHPHAFLAARAARCAGDQDHYFDYHDVLYARQPSWSVRSNAFDAFVEYAREVGLDTGDFRACLASDRHAEAVTAGAVLGEQLGVTGTPTVIVNSRRVQDWRFLPQIIDEALGRSQES